MLDPLGIKSWADPNLDVFYHLYKVFRGVADTLSVIFWLSCILLPAAFSLCLNQCSLQMEQDSSPREAGGERVSFSHLRIYSCLLPWKIWLGRGSRSVVFNMLEVLQGLTLFRSRVEKHSCCESVRANSLVISRTKYFTEFTAIFQLLHPF